MKTLDTVGTRRHQGAKAKAQQATASSQRQNRKQQKPLGGTPRMAPMQNTTQEVKVRTRSPGGAPSMATKQNTKKLNTMELRTRGLMPLRSQKMSPGM